MKITEKLALFFLLVCLMASCDRIETNSLYKVTVPVFEPMSNFRLEEDEMVVFPQPLEKTGKIYLYQNFLFINEPLKGVHIYNNANPSSPVALSFLNVPGNVDMAINDGMLYVDSYMDLLTFDIHNPERPVLVDRKENVFKLINSNLEVFYAGGLDGVLTGYKDTLVSYEDYKEYSPYIKKDTEIIYYDSNSSYGQGGSMARFTLAKNHLYAVDFMQLHLFNVSEKSAPVFVKDISLGWGIETIFPYKENLFVGSNTGMFIFDILQPETPQLISQYRHIRACDPVVVNDDYAFVTLRTGALCGGSQNLLEVIDITDLRKPQLVKSYEMQNPHGLGLADKVLYLAEGEFGLKSFQISDVNNITTGMLQHLKDKHATDVIVGPKSLVVIGEEGVCQYDYSSPSALKLLSCVSVGQSN
ncbi:LVIVD repeat-containing protein [Sphingobacterium sp. LRF_L2]|uniref:LVIVD repeat-containing protein n=1 Tax=Sphingobacterium sp. LRF_L2 TaxID=3369421 RepID=UPI003F5F705D